MSDVLKTVTDRFCLYKNARTGQQNGRQYLLSAVKSMLESKETAEGLTLGEHFGYYGHQRREMTKRLDLPETSVIMVEGKPVVLENVPACRTISVSVDDNGIVTHTQEILNTPPGRIVAAMIESKAGGWSWATGGKAIGKQAITSSFHGFDYVTNPNYVSLDHPASAHLFESAEGKESLLESLASLGYAGDSGKNIIEHFDRMAEVEMMFEATERNKELELMLFESSGRLLELEGREKTLKDRLALLENRAADRSAYIQDLADCLDELPLVVTNAQRRAFKLKSASDVDSIRGLFESLMKVSTRGLPLPGLEKNEQKVSKTGTPVTTVSFHSSSNPFAKR